MKAVNKKNLWKVSLIFMIILIVSTTAFATRTFTFQETDEINLVTNVSDPDGDYVTLSYSYPFDDYGVWDTDYEDSGEYYVEVTASDGTNADSERIKIVVEDRNRAPYFTKNSVTFDETDLIDLKELIVDPDSDVLRYQFGEPFNENGEWYTGYDDAGRYVVEILASDIEFEVEELIEIIINEKNQAPIIDYSFSEDEIIYLYENNSLTFYVEAEDNDEGDEEALTYLWMLGNETLSTIEEGEHYFNFDMSGDHELTLSVSDGELEVTRSWTLKVLNTNRMPEVDDLSVTLYETEELILDLEDTDQDGDELNYIFEEPLNHSTGNWPTGYEDAGNYTVTATANDGEFTTTFLIDIEVLDLDRAPELNFPEMLEVSEGEQLVWNVDAVDYDGDEISFEFTNLPEEAMFNLDTKNLTWNISYDYITRNEGFFTNILNSWRLEHYFTDKNKEEIEVKVCGKELCSTDTVELIVYNINRAPEITELYNQSITETETVQLFVNGEDPDGDIIRYTFSEPLSKKSGKWKTGYDDEGNYTVYVTASDGFLSETGEVEIVVNKNNRAPTIKVSDEAVKVNEGQEFTISVDVSDPDNDDLNVTLANIPEGASFYNDAFVWTPSFDTVENKTDSWWNCILSNSYYLTKKWSSESKTFWLDFTVSDGEIEVIHPVKVVVKNINRLPVIHEKLPTSSTTETTTNSGATEFYVNVEDLDGDELKYTWKFSGDFIKVEDTNHITRDFTTAGKKTVKLKVCDGRDCIKEKWTILVSGDDESDSSNDKSISSSSGSSSTSQSSSSTSNTGTTNNNEIDTSCDQRSYKVYTIEGQEVTDIDKFEGGCGEGPVKIYTVENWK